MPERDPLVRSFVHLDKKPRADAALHVLKKVASLVKPIMRARGWKVGQLTEFYPPDSSLLGLNVNKGSKICLRLRHAGDGSQFLPMESVVDTMLHELCHIVHGPHHERFHALWDQLRDELQGLMLKGYTGEGFLTQGHRLGGARMPDHEARRLARQAAETRRRQNSLTTGRRLGGAPPQPGLDMRKVIVDAVEQRNRVLRGCATERLSDQEIRQVAETATRNGFRTQAEEDAANEVAIAQALWELVQEEAKQASAQAEHTNGHGVSVATAGQVARRAATSPSGEDSSETVARASEPGSWACEACTLHNPPRYLCCDACGAERSRQRLADRALGSPSRPRATIDLTRGPSAKDRDRGRRGVPDGPPALSVPPTWTCKSCGTAMERQWWTCANCGWMKDSSR